MDLGSIFGIAQELLLQHWVFLLMSLFLGMIGSFAKKRVWTMERAKSGNPRWLWWWGRASLGFHAPIAGAMVGLVLRLFFGKDAPAGPGVNTAGEFFFYYMGSGVLSSWIYAGAKYFAKSRGIEVDMVNMPGDSIIPLNSDIKEKLASVRPPPDDDEAPPPTLS